MNSQKKITFPPANQVVGAKRGGGPPLVDGVQGGSALITGSDLTVPIVPQVVTSDPAKPAAPERLAP